MEKFKVYNDCLTIYQGEYDTICVIDKDGKEVPPDYCFVGEDNLGVPVYIKFYSIKDMKENGYTLINNGIPINLD